jgi:hypothetical protein
LTFGLIRFEARLYFHHFLASLKGDLGFLQVGNLVKYQSGYGGMVVVCEGELVRHLRKVGLTFETEKIEISDP